MSSTLASDKGMAYGVPSAFVKLTVVNGALSKTSRANELSISLLFFLILNYLCVTYSMIVATIFLGPP